MIVLHYTGMTSGKAALDWMCDPAAQVSAHYFIDEDGAVTQMVHEVDRAWHAGVASWHGETEINGCSIGIELQNPGHEHGYRGFPEAQIAALIRLIEEIRQRHEIPLARVIGHSDVAPLRKEDPGELFPWPRLAEAGCAVWPAEGGGSAAEDWMPVLAAVGYSVGEDENGPEARAALAAFQRRFLPNHLTGLPDPPTLMRLGEVAGHPGMVNKS